MKSRLKENIVAFFVALLLTFWVMMALNSSSNLATDILWVKNDLTKDADILVSFKNDKLVLQSNKNISNVSSISLEVLFDSSKIDINRDNLDSDYSLSTSKKEWWNGYTIILQNIGELKKWQDIFNISNITKKQFDNINIGHIQIISNNWDIVNLTNSK